MSPKSCVIENLLSFQDQETSKMVFALVNQANYIFPSVSRGIQCTCNALMAIIQHNANTIQEIDDILFAGDDLYRLRVGELQSTVQFIFKMLKFEELPTVVSIQHFEIKYHEQIYGTVTHENWNQSGESMNQKEGIEMLFSGYRQGLIIVGGLCPAIFTDEKSCPVFFDSHSHSQNGMSSTDGTALKITFNNIDRLVDYLFAFYQSYIISMTTQFELQPVSVTSEAGTLNLRNDINPKMDKYFQYQEDMLKKHKKSKSRETRKEYIRNYMSRKGKL